MINNIHLTNFRIHKDLFLTLNKYTLIVGSNTIGKTSILEAIHITGLGKSWKSTHSDIIRSDESLFSININNSFKYIQSARKLNILDDGISIEKKDLLNRFKVILFEPSMIYEFFNSTTFRRNDVNRILSQLYPEYLEVLSKYHRLLRNKKISLKKDVVDRVELKIWNEELENCSVKIIEYRTEYFTNLNSSINSYYSIFNSKVDWSVNYIPTLLDYSSVIDTEILIKRPTRGVHLDKIEVFKDSNKALKYSSRGELRSFLLSIKSYQASLFKESNDVSILLDDVMGELDIERQNKLLSLFENYQIIATSNYSNIDKKWLIINLDSL